MARRLTSLPSIVSLVLMRPTTVGSPANLIKRLELDGGVQSWVSRVMRRGLSTGVNTILGVHRDGAGGGAAELVPVNAALSYGP